MLMKQFSETCENLQFSETFSQSYTTNCFKIKKQKHQPNDQLTISLLKTLAKHAKCKLCE